MSCFFLKKFFKWKYKMYNSKTKMCRKTLLGPTFGSFIKKMTMIPIGHGEEAATNQDAANASAPAVDHGKKKFYMAYITEDKLGLQKFPLTGNPFDSIAIFAHPDGVANVVVSHDGKYLFTAGGENNNVFMWSISFE